MSRMVTKWIGNIQVTAQKVAADIAGNGLSKPQVGSDVGDGPLEVNVDNSTIEINTDILRVKANGITASEIDETDDYNWTGNHDFTGGDINVPAPTEDTDAASKKYVDDLIKGLDWKQSVVASTSTALPSYTYNNGTSGVGATITANANGALASSYLDGVTPVQDMRILVNGTGTTSDIHNGIYTITQVGDASNPFIFTRSEDNDEADEQSNATTWIEEGTNFGDSTWTCTANDSTPIVMGTTLLPWVQTSGLGQISAGTGLTKDGNTVHIGDGSTGNIGGINRTANEIAVAVDNSTVEINGSGILQVKDDGITGAKLAPAVAGEGISQDGSGNLDLDINDLTNTETVIDDTDLIAIHDQTDGRTEKMTVADFKAGLSYETVKQYMHKVTAGEDTAGFFTLPTSPENTQSVRLWAKQGIMQTNKQVVGATGAEPDFDVNVDGADTISINNNGSATGLSAHINTNDILIVVYAD